MLIFERIEIDLRVCIGKAVIQGTPIPVSVVLEQIARGESWDDIIMGYPELEKEDILATCKSSQMNRKIEKYWR
jgi:uncharacterized protein (DUF433 family)